MLPASRDPQGEQSDMENPSASPPDGPPPLFVVYVWSVIVAGVVVLGALAAHLDLGTATGSTPFAFWLFAGLLVAGELKTMPWIRRHDGGELTASWAFAGALLLMAPIASAVMAMAAASLLGDAAHRKGLTRTLFNAGNVTLSMASGGAVLQLASGRTQLLGPGGPSLDGLLIIAAAMLVTYFVNALLTCTVIALHQRVGVWPAVKGNVLLNFTADGMLFSLSPVLVVVAERSPALLPLLLITAWAVYRSATLATARQHEATHDQLTGLANRGLFQSHLADVLAQAARRDQRAAVVILDLDGFKEINDRLGHHIGDAVLQVVADRLQAKLEGHQLLGRLGGDEFAVCVSAIDTADEAVSLADRMLAELQRPLIVEGFPLSISGSFGVAIYPEHAAEGTAGPAALMEKADLAMYEAKRAGLGVVLYRPGAGSAGPGRLSLLADLQRAIDNGDLTLHYQPKMSVTANLVVGVEALVRWRHPRLGPIPPSEFVALAEHTELIHPFTDFVLREALRQCRQWQALGLHIPVAINASARNVHDLRFPSVVQARLREADLDAAWLEIEITENTVMADPARAVTVLQELRAMGIRLSIDDFGTGYSSLSSLRDMPVDAIKIDRSFVSRMTSDDRDRLIVKSMIELARGLGLGTVAEGVETAEDRQALAALGCDTTQGYLICAAKPAADLTTWLQAHSLTASATASGGCA